VAFIVSIGQEGETTIQSFRVILALAAVSSFISGIIVLITEEKPPKETISSLQFSRLIRDPRLTRYLLLNFMYGTVMSFAWPLFPMIITHRLKMRVWQISTLSITSSLVSTLTQRRLGLHMDQFGRKPVIVFSRVIMAVAPVSYALARQWWHIAFAELFLGLGMAAWMSSESTYIIDLAPGELRATYLASSTAAFGLASFLGSNVSGYVVDKVLQGLDSLNEGLFISSGLRIIFGLAYLSAFESVNVE
jgi:MFS family permease